jgi:hypothetical protein
MVTFIDFIGEGHRNHHWPTGFTISHGARGEVVHIERSWKDTTFTDGTVLKGIPTRYQVSWCSKWFYALMKGAYGYKIPDFVEDGCGPIEWAHYLHVVKNPSKEEVKQLEDIKRVTEEILHSQPWTYVLKVIQMESPLVQWLRKNYPTNKDEGRLPGDSAYVIRKAAAYDWISSRYQKTGVEDLQQRYEILRNAALNEVAQKLAQEGVEVQYTHSTQPTTGKEKHVMAKKVAAPTVEAPPEKTVTKKAEKKAVKAVETVKRATSSSAGGRRVEGSQVTVVLRETDPTPKAICKAMLEAFGVKVDPSRISDAPNAGIMKMRAGNLVRGQLRREDRLA